jgi:hypothetical protein
MRRTRRSRCSKPSSPTACGCWARPTPTRGCPGTTLPPPIRRPGDLAGNRKLREESSNKTDGPNGEPAAPDDGTEHRRLHPGATPFGGASRARRLPYPGDASSMHTRIQQEPARVRLLTRRILHLKTLTALARCRPGWRSNRMRLGLDSATVAGQREPG